LADNSDNLDHLLKAWPFTEGEVLVRCIAGDDGRELLQMRVDLGVLQLETRGRPDGQQPEGFETYYDYLIATAFAEGEGFQLSEQQCMEVDREFYQFYHRRVCWLALKKYSAAMRDAEHTLALMDFTSANTPDPEWAQLHEQYRPFVLFHKIQAEALVGLQRSAPHAAIQTLDRGLAEVERLFEGRGAGEYFEEDPFVLKLREMREAVFEHYRVEPTLEDPTPFQLSLAEQLADAIAKEQYELAAKIRDRIAIRRRGK
jgi:hypothetical protein